MLNQQSNIICRCLLLLQFDALVAALPLAEGGEEAQLKRIAELQVYAMGLLDFGFSTRSMNTSSYWSSQDNHKIDFFAISCLDASSRNRSNYTPLHFLLQIFDNSTNFWAKRFFSNLLL